MQSTQTASYLLISQTGRVRCVLTSCKLPLVKNGPYPRLSSMHVLPGKVPKPSKAYKKDGNKLDLGDLLGRSKEGFQPLKTEDDDAVIISSDSDVEDFSVPALHT